MVSAPLKPNVQDLQKDVIELLGEISALMNRASTALSSDGSSEKYAKFQQEVTNAARNVEDLELRMAIVAPMKAGKSTIINAIIGQELLPSRNAAMTTLPTEMIFDANLTEPLLILSPEIRDAFQRTFFALQDRIRKLGNEIVQEKIAQYPHLAKLALGIQAKTGGSIAEKISGHQRVINNLGALNDIVRLCSVLDPLADPLQYLTDVPRIYTPFWRSQKSAQANLLGNLVIVDTPGPNEAGENLRLVNVVSEQLQNSSLVLLVLDFTQLRTEAAEKVKQDVQRVIDLRGKENLYVLINKVDQRRKGDMTPEQVQQFVAAELGIGGSDNTERVFEVSARWAFSAANFMHELQQYPNTSIAQMKTTQALAQDVFGIDWEEELEEATIEDLQKKAERLWKKSGFAPFLEKAIGALMADAAPRCMISALNIASGCLAQLHDDVQLRGSAINEDEAEIRLQVGLLEDDLRCIEECRNRLHEVDRIKGQLYQSLNEILEALKQQAKVSLETYFNEEKYQRADFLQKGGIVFNNFFSWFSQQFNSQEVLNAQSGSLIEFKSYQEAEEFAEQALAYPKERINILLESVREQVRKRIEKSRQELTELLENETKPIIKRARNRLNETFSVNLSLPTPPIDSDEVDFTKPRIRNSTKWVEQGYEYKTVKRRKFTHWFWLVPKEEKVRVKRPDKKEDYYTVCLQEIIDESNKLIEQSIKNIKQGINQYLDEDFKQRIDTFFNDLDHYLSNYCDSLMQAQAAQQLSLDQKETLVMELNSLSSDAIKNLKMVDSKLEYTKNLMVGQ